MMLRALRLALLSLLTALTACEAAPERVVAHRPNCEVCHQPRDEEGSPHGIEQAHPWSEVSCVTCHGGQDWVCDGAIGGTPSDPECSTGWVYDMDRAHVSPSYGPSRLRQLRSGELDEVDPAYLRFVNPGDFRVVDETCGPCHEAQSDLAKTSPMAHAAGELAAARYRAGKQPSPVPVYASTDMIADGDNTVCSANFLTEFDPQPIAVGTVNPATAASAANAVEQMLAKTCVRCHLNDFGDNRFAGDFRSSGCSACHMPYNEDGSSASNDPTLNPLTIPHPAVHEMTAAPDDSTCGTCHHDGTRVGLNYAGMRNASDLAEANPDNPGTLGRSLHGKDPHHYILDEQAGNGFDETPPDVHQEAGMGCIDCHTSEELHGNGHLGGDAFCAVKTECTDCHGTVRARALLQDPRHALYERDGAVYLTLKSDGRELQVPQAMDVVTPGHERYNEAAEQAMGVNENGFSHTDEMECYTCHSSWLPSCYGCHVEVDLLASGTYHTTGEQIPGKIDSTLEWVALHDLVLMRNQDGMIAPSAPGDRLFMSLIVEDPDVFEPTPVEWVSQSPRRFEHPDGRVGPGFGQRAYHPHTVRSRTAFMACDRCHTAGDESPPSNAALLDLTHGFGTQRFPREACDVTQGDGECPPGAPQTTYQLDAIQTQAGVPLIAPRDPSLDVERPLTLDEIEAMRAIKVPASAPIQTPIPSDATTNKSWPGPLNLE
ncbi:MAG: hypothetical protein ACPGU1_17435 [Myxococcota bacterium]